MFTNMSLKEYKLEAWDELDASSLFEIFNSTVSFYFHFYRGFFYFYIVYPTKL